MPSPRPDQYYQSLAKKWLDGSITDEEKRAFAAWYNDRQDEPVEIPESVAVSEEQHRNRILATIESRIAESGKTRIFPLYRASVAAAVALFILVLGGYFLLKNRNSPNPAKQELATSTDIAPGGDKATLTLGDGSVIDLETRSDGSIRNEKGLNIRKQQGALIYEVTETLENKVSYNTITTPRGGQFRIVLPDGSKVWLNASSSLQYPTQFDGKVRNVKLFGEAYFEIAKLRSDKGKPMPFLINVSDREKVEVLGTHFNIMAYSDEQVIRTTLLEGSVRVSKSGTGHTRLLRPGQQSVSSSSKGFEIRNDIDPAESISWKNGQILFKDANIRSIMRQIARWYDVDIKYEGEVPDRLFNGGISRSSNLSSVLKVLELNDIHFKVEKKTITVTP